ncbi:MAG: hypothetical protein FWG91_06415 [Lachnospiraceae bacterium]|nr:hypothetical protein [Lachnospiraceae bacterium]
MLKIKKVIFILLALIIILVFVVLIFAYQGQGKGIRIKGDDSSEVAHENDDFYLSNEAREEVSLYIGRQPPEGYAEPTHLDSVGHKWLQDDGFMADYYEYWEDHIALKDEFESNIVILFPEDFFENIFSAAGFDEYVWFEYTPTKDDLHGTLRNDYAWICYAILTYYDGEVPYNFHVSPESIYSKFYDKAFTDNSMYRIFDVQIYGENPLHIRIDTFNYKIRVDEGILKED